MAKRKTQIAERFHPGEYVRDEMEARGWSLETMVAKTGIGRPRLEQIIAEKWNLTMMDCDCLARAFDTSRELWQNLQKSFNEWTPAEKAS